MTDQETGTIDITPTDDGYRMMRQALKESIEKYNTDIIELDEVLDKLQSGVLDLQLSGSHFVAEVPYNWMQFVEDGLNLLQAAKEESVQKLQAGVDEIDRYLGPEES